MKFKIILIAALLCLSGFIFAQRPTNPTPGGAGTNNGVTDTVVPPTKMAMWAGYGNPIRWRHTPPDTGMVVVAVPSATPGRAPLAYWEYISNVRGLGATLTQADRDNIAASIQPDETRLIQDSILVYRQNGAEIGRDTITGTGGDNAVAYTAGDNINLVGNEFSAEVGQLEVDAARNAAQNYADLRANQTEKLGDYNELSNYTGNLETVIITEEGTAGVFIKDPSATNVDGGIVPVSGWRRVVSGLVETSWYGTVPDGESGTNGIVTQGSNILNVTTNRFTPEDVGKSICVSQDSLYAIWGTIQTVNSPTEISISVSSQRTLENVRYNYGTDNRDAIQSAWTFAVNNGYDGIKITAGGYYHCSQPLNFSSQGSPDGKPKFIDGYGAELGNTFVINSSDINTDGVYVKDSPNDGFVLRRGQGTQHRNLTVWSCAGNGIVLGAHSQKRSYQGNSQVANVLLLNARAERNRGHGIAFNGTATANRSFFNANTITGLTVRNNFGGGICDEKFTEDGNTSLPGATGPVGPQEMNYNTWIGAQFEGNWSKNGGAGEGGGLSVVMPQGAQNTWIGGHFVDHLKNVSNRDSISADLGSFAFVWGGRYRGNAKCSTCSVMYNSTKQFEGAYRGDLPVMDNISTRNLTVDGASLTAAMINAISDTDELQNLQQVYNQGTGLIRQNVPNLQLQDFNNTFNNADAYIDYTHDPAGVITAGNGFRAGLINGDFRIARTSSESILSTPFLLDFVTSTLTLGGVLEMSGNKITGVDEGTNPTDVANYGQLLAATGGGGAMNKGLSTANNTDANGDITITHGLSSTPGLVVLTLNQTEAYRLAYHDANGTTFKVRVTDTNGAIVANTNVRFAWIAYQ